VPEIVSRRNIVADLRSGWSSRVELDPGVVFSPAFTLHLSTNRQKWFKFSRVPSSFLTMVGRKSEALYTNH
jgi:hypothetical protein